MGGHYATLQKDEKDYKDRALLPSLLKLLTTGAFLKSIKQVISCLKTVDEQTHLLQHSHIRTNLALARSVVSSILLCFLTRKRGILFLFENLSQTEAILSMFDPYSLRTCSLPICIDYLPLNLTSAADEESQRGGVKMMPYTATPSHLAVLFRYHMHALVGLDMLMSLCDPSGKGHIDNHESLVMSTDKGIWLYFYLFLICFTFICCLI